MKLKYLFDVINMLSAVTISRGYQAVSRHSGSSCVLLRQSYPTELSPLHVWYYNLLLEANRAYIKPVHLFVVPVSFCRRKYSGDDPRFDSLQCGFGAVPGFLHKYLYITSWCAVILYNTRFLTSFF